MSGTGSTLEWWQYALSAVAVLGLSPAPWVAAMLAGRLRPIGWTREQVKAKDDEIERERAAAATERTRADTERERADLERDRADRASARLVDVALELGASTVKLLEALPKPEGLGE
jgi:hypothetical protein